jgi:predicted nucleic acid-binding protein
MEKSLRVIVDTDVLIKAYRGDKLKIKNLNLLKDKYCISIISAIELIAGAKSIKQLAAINKVLKVYDIYFLDESISQRALNLYKKHILKQDLGLSDCFIGATALKYGLELYTDNKKDYRFMEGIKFYREK